MWTVAANFRRTHSQVDWLGLGLAATRRSVYIHQMNRVNSCNDWSWWQHHKHCHDYYYYYYMLAVVVQVCRRLLALVSTTSGVSALFSSASWRVGAPTIRDRQLKTRHAGLRLSCTGHCSCLTRCCSQCPLVKTASELLTCYIDHRQLIVLLFRLSRT